MRLLPTIALALFFSGSALAEGPGTRIRTGSDLPRHPDSLQRNDSGSCERLRGEARDRCLKDRRKPAEADRGTGSESTGMGSGAGAGSSSGTSGGASFGASAPR